MYLVSAWAEANRFVLGQVAADARSNEITAIPALPKSPDPTGCLVPVEAMGCHTLIAAHITAAQAAARRNRPQRPTGRPSPETEQQARGNTQAR